MYIARATLDQGAKLGNNWERLSLAFFLYPDLSFKFGVALYYALSFTSIRSEHSSDSENPDPWISAKVFLLVSLSFAIVDATIGAYVLKATG